jgi:hypothetical protein
MANQNSKKTLSEITRGLRKGPALQTQFILPVASVSEDGATANVKLCTGGALHIPTSLVKNIASLGNVQSGDERLAIVSGEIDVSTDAGKALQQTAHEITRLSRTLRTTQEELLRLKRARTPVAANEENEPVGSELQIVPFDYVLPSATIKIQFFAIAGDGHTIVYTVPDFHYIEKWSVSALYNCFMTRQPFITAFITGHPDWPLQIEFFLEAAHGTPLGTNYYGAMELDLVLVQETT